MTSAVVTTGLNASTYRALFRKQILRVRPPVVGMAVAYVSASGFSLVQKILNEGGVGEVRLVTDIKDGVTHPKALQGAVESGWNYVSSIISRARSILNFTWVRLALTTTLAWRIFLS